MRLYNCDATGLWFGTAAEYKEHCIRTLGIPSRQLHIDTSNSTDVPTDKAGLIEFLNNLANKPEYGRVHTDGSRSGGQPVAKETPETEIVGSPDGIKPTRNPTWDEKREKIFNTMTDVERYISDSGYEEARRIQGLAAERMVEHVAVKREKLK